MALLIRLDAVYGPGRVPEATGTGTSCPVRLGSPTGDSRREVEPPGRRLRAASAAPARRDFIRHIELAARGKAATSRAFPSVLAPSAVRSRSILGGTSEGGGLVKVFVTLLTGIQGQREGVYEVNRDFLKRLRRPVVALSRAPSVTELSSTRLSTIPLHLVHHSTLPRRSSHPRAPAFEKRVPPLLLPSSQQLVFIAFCRNF